MAIVWPSATDKSCWSGSLLTTKGAAKALGVSTQTMLNYVKDKRFPRATKRQQGNRHYYLFTKAKVEEFEAKRREIRGNK
jgi:predicted DNA-binding transcriptional regulator AlpA